MKIFKKSITLILSLLLVISLFGCSAKNTNHNEYSSDIQVNATLNDSVENDTIWCGSFQLVWNELVDNFILDSGNNEIIKNLNQKSFTTNSISNDSYYITQGVPTFNLKRNIENDLKNKFNEKSEILNNIQWSDDGDGYLLYAMLKKDLSFESKFEKLDKDYFKNFSNIKYFGVNKNTKNNLDIKNQISVLFYENKDNFAISIKTAQDDNIVFYKNPQGNTFNEIYNNISIKSKNCHNTFVSSDETIQIPYIAIKTSTAFDELNGLMVYNDDKSFVVDQAIQTINFDLTETGAKLKSEAAIVMDYAVEPIDKEPRSFILNDTFAIFMIENNADTPYFAAKINDITKFQ